MINLPTMLITGNSSGVGRDLTKFYLSNSFQIIGCSRHEPDFQSENYRHFILDIADEKSVKNMFNQIRKDYGRIDYLINNAGVSSTNYLMLVSLKELRKVFETNVYGTVLCCREAVKLMKNNNFGRIINFSSIHTKLKINGSSIYGSSKSAIENFSNILAKEIFQYGITVNVLSLSIVSGSGMAKKLSDKITKKILNNTASKTFLKTEDITNVINFLIDNKSKMITGQNICLG